MSNINICPKCGTKAELFYCPNCGEIFSYPSFIGGNDSRKKSLQTFISNVITVAKQQKLNVSEAIGGSSIRNAIYRKYYEHIAYLQKLCSNKTTYSYFMNSGINMFEQMNSFAEKCESGYCQIAVVGTVKAGKSAFINALIGKEIASSYPTPETASVTKFKKSEIGNYVKVAFYTTKEWKTLWDSVHSSTAEAIEGDENEDFIHLYENLHAEDIRAKYLDKQAEVFNVNSIEEQKAYIDKFTSARFPEHFFAKEVEVGLSDFFAPSNVVIVDTPGLDDPVPYRTNITRRYLHKANVILLCIRSNRPEISSTELTQLSYIFQELRYYKDRIITIGTQIDEPDDMLNYWKNYTLPEYLKYLSRSTLYGSKEIAEKHIFPLSAFYYFYIQKAIENPHIFIGKTDEEKKYRKKILEIVRRYYDIPEMEELVEEYGKEKAMMLFKSPRQIFEEHKEELLDMTQVPKVRKMILDGPIKNANEIILSDIESLYKLLINEVRNVSTDIASHRNKTIEMSESSDVLERISTLEKRIKEEKVLQREQADKLSGLLSDLEKHSQNALNKIKS